MGLFLTVVIFAIVIYPIKASLCFEHAYYVAVYFDAEPVYRLTDVRVAFPQQSLC